MRGNERKKGGKTEREKWEKPGEKIRIHFLTIRTMFKIILTKGSFPQRKPEVSLPSGF